MRQLSNTRHGSPNCKLIILCNEVDSFLLCSVAQLVVAKSSYDLGHRFKSCLNNSREKPKWLAWFIPMMRLVQLQPLQ